MGKNIMDTETTEAPPTTQLGRENPAGSRGEKGQKPGNLDAALPTSLETGGANKYECMSCGKLWQDAVASCPDCGGHTRKVGKVADPVYADQLAGARNDPPLTGGSAAKQDSPGRLKQQGMTDMGSVAVEDISARGEKDRMISGPEDPKMRKRQGRGGDHRLQGERVHPTDTGSASGGGGGTGA